jgi:YidC/Oxa1 family membrane protein insertase
VDIGALWDQFVVRGIFVNALVYLYEQLRTVGLPSWGLAIILFTVIVKSLTLPLTLKSVRSMKRMQEIQPKMQALQRQHKGDKEKLMQEQMALYKEHGVNPVAGCLPMLVQMPIWIALYWALFHLAAAPEAGGHPEFAKPFLWIANLGQPEFKPENFPHQLPILAILTGVTQWITTKMAQQPTTDPQQQMMNSVMQYMPVMFVFFSLSVPAGLVLYWVASNLYQMVQQYFITGWGQLVPARAPAADAAGGRGAAPRPSPNRPASNARSKADGAPSDGAPVDALATEEPRAPRSPSTGGRKRRTKRR